MIRHLPNAITLLNLLCGVWAIHALYNGQVQDAIGLIGIAALFDFFDGMAARMLQVASPIGKDLDSLADMVSFGVFPGLLLSEQLRLHTADASADSWSSYLYLIAYLIPAASALRLAKFNHDTRQSDGFIGLPTPANTLIICALVWINQQPMHWFFIINSEITLTIPFSVWLFLALYLPWMLNSEIRLLALKFKTWAWKSNSYRYGFLITSLPFLVIGSHGFALILLNYLMWSFIYNWQHSASS